MTPKTLDGLSYSFENDSISTTIIANEHEDEDEHEHEHEHEEAQVRHAHVDEDASPRARVEARDENFTQPETTAEAGTSTTTTTTTTTKTTPTATTTITSTTTTTIITTAANLDQQRASSVSTAESLEGKSSDHVPNSNNNAVELEGATAPSGVITSRHSDLTASSIRTRGRRGNEGAGRSSRRRSRGSSGSGGVGGGRASPTVSFDLESASAEVEREESSLFQENMAEARRLAEDVLSEYAGFKMDRWVGLGLGLCCVVLVTCTAFLVFFVTGKMTYLSVTKDNSFRREEGLHTVLRG